MTRRHILFLIPLALVFAACKNTDDNIPEREEDSPLITLTEDQFTTNAFEVDGLTQKSFPSFVRAQGLIDVPPRDKAVVHAMMGGFVKGISLLEGDKVERGQVLLSLENPQFVELQQDYLETREQLAFLETEFDRQSALYKENITSEKNFLKAESDYNTALARLASLNKRLELLGISPENLQVKNITSEVLVRSPISGHVSAIYVNIGSYASENDALLEIVDNSHLHIEMQVFETDVPKIKKGQTILFNASESSDEQYRGIVYLVGTTIHGETRTTPVYGHMPDSISHRFAVGMFVEAEIETQSFSTAALPEEAVVDVEGEYFALLSVNTENREFKKVTIVPGKTHDGYVEIKNADTFPASAKFLVKGAYALVGE